MPIPLCGMEDVNHKPVGMIVPSFFSVDGVLKAGSVATEVAREGVVTMDMPRPEAKVLLV